VRSTSSSLKWEYPLQCLRSSSSFLRLLPRLLVISISTTPPPPNYITNFNCSQDVPFWSVEQFTGYPEASPGIFEYTEVNTKTVLFYTSSSTHFSRKSKSSDFVSVFKNVVTLGISRFLSPESYVELLNSAKTLLGADILLQSEFISKYER
jgi:hypothetical protein